MTSWIFDATPLIYLAKAQRLDLLEQLEGERIIPERVHREVVIDGLEEGYSDARRVDLAADDGLFHVHSAPETESLTRLRENPNLSDADAAVLALAESRAGTAVMDERYGRSIAEAEGIETRGTAYLILRLSKNGEITPQDARKTIDAMVDAGWYCAPDVYAKILRTLESFTE